MSAVEIGLFALAFIVQFAAIILFVLALTWFDRRQRLADRRMRKIQQRMNGMEIAWMSDNMKIIETMSMIVEKMPVKKAALERRETEQS